MAVVGNSVTLDAPLTNSLDSKLSRATVAAYSWLGRIERVGIEYLKCESDFDSSNPNDEEHAWDAIGLISFLAILSSGGYSNAKLWAILE